MFSVEQQTTLTPTTLTTARTLLYEMKSLCDESLATAPLKDF